MRCQQATFKPLGVAFPLSPPRPHRAGLIQNHKRLNTMHGFGYYGITTKFAIELEGQHGPALYKLDEHQRRAIAAALLAKDNNLASYFPIASDICSTLGCLTPSERMGAVKAIVSTL